MTINVPQAVDCFNRWQQGYDKVDVTYSTTYDGIDIYRDAEKWYYVKALEWQRFGTLREAKRFIDNWYRE